MSMEALRCIMTVTMMVMAMMMMTSASDETYEEIVSRSSGTVRFNDSLTINWSTAPNSRTYWSGFTFGLGYAGDAVRTDIEVTLRRTTSGNLVTCPDGQLVELPGSTSPLPVSALFRVRPNGTISPIPDVPWHTYKLEVGQSSPALFLDFSTRSCLPGVESIPVCFDVQSSASTL